MKDLVLDNVSVLWCKVFALLVFFASYLFSYLFFISVSFLRISKCNNRKWKHNSNYLHIFPNWMLFLYQNFFQLGSMTNIWTQNANVLGITFLLLNYCLWYIWHNILKYPNKGSVASKFHGYTRNHCKQILWYTSLCTCIDVDIYITWNREEPFVTCIRKAVRTASAL